jgi:nucleoside-diphosphate-sugar epimerase
MSRIGVIGANGQVGAEVCLLLAAQPDVDVVPLCRNRSGSAFLRSRGLACRHGRVGAAGEARALLSDCDVVVSFARPTSRPREMRAMNETLAANMAEGSAAGARLVYFSSYSFYRRFRPVHEPASVTAYGWEKRDVEKMIRRHAARTGKDSWILRVGHVTGELQQISLELRRLIRCGPVVVPNDGSDPSNVVYTATIVDAILAIAKGQEPAGTYDLCCIPSWSWRRVLEHEAAASGGVLRIEPPVPPIPTTPRVRGGPRAWIARSLTTRPARELGLIALNFMSSESNLKAQSEHFQRRARTEIAEILRRPPSADAFLFAAAGSTYMSSLRETASLLAEPSFRLSVGETTGGFAPDRPLAV